MFDERQIERICMIAFVCSPGKGSEYEVGWSWSQNHGSSRRVHVLCRSACWDDIPGRARRIRGAAVKVVKGSVYVRIDIPVVRRMLVGRRFTRFHYMIWQSFVLRFLWRRRCRYVLVHHVSFVGAWLPPFEAFGPLPFIWGPIGTNRRFPDWWSQRAATRDRLFARTRELVTRFTPAVNPLVRFGQSKAQRLIVIDEDVRTLIRQDAHWKTAIRPAIGIGRAWFTPSPFPRQERRRAVLFAGRNLVTKLPDIAFEVASALARKHPEVETTMVGEGLPKRFSSSKAVHVMASVPQAEVRSMMDRARVFLFPSIENSGFVVLEAMARGLPVVCLKSSGAAAFAGTEGGIAVSESGTAQDIVRRLEDACSRLLYDDVLWDAMSQGAYLRAEKFEWSQLGPWLTDIYNDVLDQAHAGR